MFALLLGGLACSPSAPPLSAPTVPATPVASVSLIATSTPTPLSYEDEEPRFQFRGTALERLDAKGRALWSAELPAERSRQMAVLGDVVLVWDTSNTLRRFEIASGRQVDEPIRVGQVLDFLVHGEILVQSTVAGMVGVGEKANLWHRPGLRASSMVVGGSSENPVVLLVASADGRAHVLDLENGKDAKFPVPKGTFSRVAFERDSGVVTWQPRKGGQPVMTDGETGEVI